MRGVLLRPHCLLLAIACLGGCGHDYQLCPYPNAAYVPPFHLPDAPDQVHAFRVVRACAPVTDACPVVFEPVEISTGHAVGMQWQWRWSDSSIHLVEHLPMALLHTEPHKQMHVFVYRPGYATVSFAASDLLERMVLGIPAGIVFALMGEDHPHLQILRSRLQAAYGTTSPLSLRPHVHWTPTPDLAAQVKALDDVFAQGRELIAPGSHSPGHRQALVFGAAEYDRLVCRAMWEETPQQLQDRLRSRARQLRELAEQ